MITFFSRKTLASRINVAFNNTFSISNYNSLVFKANFSSTSYLNVNSSPPSSEFRIDSNVLNEYNFAYLKDLAIKNNNLN